METAAGDSVVGSEFDHDVAGVRGDDARGGCGTAESSQGGTRGIGTVPYLYVVIAKSNRAQTLSWHMLRWSLRAFRVALDVVIDHHDPNSRALRNSDLPFAICVVMVRLRIAR